MVEWLSQQFWQWWNWVWSDAGGAWAQAVVALAALVVAVLAFLENRTAARAAFRPLLRPVKVRRSRGRHPANYLIVKNYGSGPAMSLMLFEAGYQRGISYIEPNEILNDSIDVLEPLGPRTGLRESERAGRRIMPLRSALKHNSDYRLFYQDKDGVFYETRFTYDSEAPVLRDIKYIGERKPADMPPIVPFKALVKRRW